RAALKWAGALPEAPEVSLRLAGALARFWYLHGYWSEGRGWLRQSLAAAEPGRGPTAAPTTIAVASLRRGRARPEARRARRGGAMAGLAWLMDENGEDVPLYQASLALYQELDDRAGMATALRGWGATLVNQAEHAQARLKLEEALELFRSAAHPWGVAIAQY